MIDRRDFISRFAGALAGFAVLPAATTYTRLWKAVRVPRFIPNPAYLDAPYIVGFVWGGEMHIPGAYGLRLTILPPDEAWKDATKFHDWMKVDPSRAPIPFIEV